MKNKSQLYPSIPILKIPMLYPSGKLDFIEYVNLSRTNPPQTLKVHTLF